MKCVYSKGDKFCAATFIGLHEKALANGYVWVSDEDYEALRKHEKCWKDGVLVDYTKSAEEIATEKRRANQKRIDELKANLSGTDYQAIKYAEGLLNDIEYEPIRVQRQAWRDEINRLEDELRY